MKKFIIAPLALAAMFAISGGTGSPRAAAAPTAPEFGACRWYCGSGPSFQTRAACTAVCSTDCEQIC